MAKQRQIQKVNRASLELTNICNLDCTFCTSGRMVRPKGKMDEELAIRLIDEIAETNFSEYIVTNVMGEPLLYKGLFNILRHGKERGRKMEVISNGRNLTERVAKELLDAAPYQVNISYHAHDSQSYKYKMSNLPFEQYKQRVFDFIDLKFATKSDTIIDISSISTINNPTDKFKILDNATDIEVFSNEWLSFAEHLKKKYKINFNVPKKMHPGITMLLPGFCVSYYLSYFDWAGAILPQNTKKIPSHDKFCVEPFTTFNVLWNGDTTLCCIDHDGELVYDNVSDKSIIDVFNCDSIIDVRKGFLDKEAKVHSKCADCCGSTVSTDGSPRKCAEKIYEPGLIDNIEKAISVCRRLSWLGFGEIKNYVHRKAVTSRQGSKLREKYWNKFYEEK